MHPRPRRSHLTAYFLSLVCFALFVCATQAACNKSQRQDTLHASIIAVDSASAGFVTWDREHQQQLVDGAASHDDGLAQLNAYKARRALVTDAIVVAYRAIGTAATQQDDLSLQAAIASSSALIDAIKALIGGK